MRIPVQVASVALLLGISSIASAEPGSNCPPGSWFCADINVPNAPGANAPKGIDSPKEAPKEAAPDAPNEAPKGVAKDPPKQLAPGDRTDRKRFDDSNPTDESPSVAPPREAPPPPVVVVRPAPRPYHEPRPAAVRQARYHDQSEWGFNMHILGAMMGSKKNSANQGSNDSGMGGLGFILRARPTGHFAIDFGLDFVNGTDY